VSEGRKLNVIDHRVGAVSLRRDNLTYSSTGDIHTINRQDGGQPQALWTYSHDKSGQLTRAVKSFSGGGVVARYGYGYDAAGNRITNQRDDSVSTWFYDDRNRLVGETPGGQLRVAGLLDEPGSVVINGVKAEVSAANGFAAQVATQPGTTQINVTATDASGNLRAQSYEVDQAGVPRTFVYDANGNVTSDGSATYEWDARNRLVAVNGPQGRRDVSYDAFGRPYRVVDTPSGQPSTGKALVWCGFRVCQERDTTGASVLVRQYPLGFATSSGNRFYSLDHLGRRVLTTDASGTPKGKVEYDPVWSRPAVGSRGDRVHHA
jgi:YD repeat-containing protein